MGTMGSMVLSRSADADLRRRERAENFPVASRLLPRSRRVDLRAVYDVARVIDDLGDEATGDRLDGLAAFRSDLARVWADGEPETPVLRALVPTVRDRRLPPEPLDQLVEANVLDQTVTRYATYDDLRGYCALSAHPIGRLVLAIFDVDSPRAAELSDRVCAALQLLEHWQDVAEDYRSGRIYLPAEDLAAYGLTEADLAAAVTAARSTPALRQLLAFETERAAALLSTGAPIVRELHGWARIAVAGYVAGGRAAAAALTRALSGAGPDVLAVSPRTRRRDVARHLGPLLGGKVA